MVANIICSKCGQENGAEQTFCASCGAFLEWSGQGVAAEPAPEAPSAKIGGARIKPGATPTPAPGSELAGLARRRPSRTDQPPATRSPSAPAGPLPAVPLPSQPPLVAPVKPGPSRRSIPRAPVAPVAPGPADAGAAPKVASDPTIACPACGRPNPVNRNFCHSCGTLLRPRPRQPMARRRRSGGGPYRILSILLLIAILLVGSILLTRLTTTKGGSSPSPSPSPSRASVTLLIRG